MWRAIRDAVKASPMDVGESTRVRHDECEHRSNGTTLDIRRTDDGYLGYCFRCDTGGMYNGGLGTKENYKRTGKNAHGSAKRSYQRSERTSCFAEFPVGVKLWLNQSRIAPATLVQEGVRWNSTLERLEFPVPGHAATVNRNYGRDSEGRVLPKYTSRVPYQLRRLGETALLNEKGHTLVVVEDWLSCLQCYLAGYSALALFTTSIKQDALVLCAKQGYTRVIVALDHDNVTVIANERKLMRQFRLFSSNVVGVELTKDPKEFTTEELREILG